MVIAAEATQNPLSSWTDGAVRSAILNFVDQVTHEGSPYYVPPSERIATFDNDGTLWCEQPIQVQAYFLLERVRMAAVEKPELIEQQPFKAILEHDKATIATFGKKEIANLFFVTHTGMSPEAFQAIALPWLNTATHPRFNQLFKACTYQPMRELLDYLKANGFTNYIVSAGGLEFMRAITAEIYGIPPQQVIGSSSDVQLNWEDGNLVLTKMPELYNFNDRAEKVKNIYRWIGQRPVLAFGNSDGDLNMLQYTAAGSGLHLSLLLHHDDAEREYAYDRDFKLSPLVEGLDVVPQLNGGIKVSMKQDWNQVFSFAYRD